MYILVGSVTTATRLKKVAEKIIGFPAYVVHTPSALNQGGCSYSVRVDDRALNEIRKIAGDNEIPIRRIYIERTDRIESSAKTERTVFIIHNCYPVHSFFHICIWLIVVKK